MPNWCLNSVRITNPDPNMITRAEKAFAAGEFFNEFAPVPRDLKETVEGYMGDGEEQRELEIKQAYNLKNYGYKTWYAFCVNEWGTKWDVGSADEVTKEDDNTLSLNFESAWSPPIQFYDKLKDYGFEVSAYFYEPGMGFCGRYDAEYGEESMNISGLDSETVREVIGEDIDDAFGISESMAEWEDQQEEEAES